MPCLCHSRARLRTINTAISGAKARKWAICSNNIGLAHRLMAQKDDMLVAARPLSRDVAAPMTDTDMISADALVPTPTICAQPRRFSDFATVRSEEHTSELQSLMRISYAVFCLKTKKHNTKQFS